MAVLVGVILGIVCCFGYVVYEYFGLIGLLVYIGFCLVMIGLLVFICKKRPPKLYDKCPNCSGELVEETGRVSEGGGRFSGAMVSDYEQQKCKRCGFEGERRLFNSTYDY